LAVNLDHNYNLINNLTSKLLRLIMKKMILLFWVTVLGIGGYFIVKNVQEKRHLVVGLTGDVMLGRLVNQTLAAKGPAYPWGNTTTLLNNNDFNIINLECMLTKSEKRVFKVFNFKSDPDNVQSLVQANISLVNLANNHCLDFSEEGLKETIQTLESKKIKHVGAGENINQARKFEILEKNGIKIGVIGYTDNEPDWLATSEKPGTNYVKIGQIEQIEESIKLIRNQVDIVIVSIHWGPNRIERPEPAIIDFAHKIIDCGADIIHGHSAHIFHGIEIYKNKVILYGTGDFIDDYMIYPDQHNDQSFLFQVKITKKGVAAIELVPVYISEMQVNLAQDDLAQKILKRIKKLSAELGTEVEIKDNHGFVNIKK
jgi:poly-gamma-glutamate synthesis protein (capsule biosynthesis protein)